ncbi:hypothetical protein C1Y40_04134 [Mycobacterium talmoniae]|uniref:Uncharacterized protein n=1 Tax=Mycobacterium talmoniae TaxID=1858794 RepID=A0A2S8BG91_9MYCO|nr:hypothetical protein C1Y40_04134 [Mycobacterium talmoniae]
MSDFTDRIAEILREHTPFDQFDVEIDPVGKCGKYHLGEGAPCDVQMHYEQWPAHVAALIAEAAEQHYRRRIDTVRWFAPAYTALNGNVVLIGDRTVLPEMAERQAKHLRSDDDEAEVFVAYRDLPAWQRWTPGGEQ